MSVNNKQISSRKLSRRDVLRYGLYSSLAAGLPSNLWISGCRKQQSVKKPNVFLITVDTLRADHLGCYGYFKNTSPNIDQFAEDALLFENCLSHAPVTKSSLGSLLSGFLPHEIKMAETTPLLPEVQTLAEILKRSGYKTIAVISNYVLRKNVGFEQGFMIYDDTMKNRELVRRCPERIAEHTTDRVIKLLKKFCKYQLFTWVHYQDPHGPYTPPEYFAKMFLDPNQEPHNLRVNDSASGLGGIPSYQELWQNRDFHYYVSQYDGEIRYQDEHFKRLIATLKELGLYDTSLIIFSSDHGEELGEHNYFFTHGENLYNNLTHVPLIIKYGNQLSGRRTDYVQHIDVVPTILGILGLETNSRFRGCDLRQQHLTKKEVYAEMKYPPVDGQVKFSITLDGMKLIYTPSVNKSELFDLKTDPHELHNLVNDNQYTEQLEDLKARLQRIRKEDFLQIHKVNKFLELTDEEKAKLKSLGYVR